MKRSIGLVEITSIPVGVTATDAMAKAAAVEVIQALPVCPGKYIALVAGEVGAVNAAIRAAEAVAGPALADKLVLPNVHESLFPALSGALAAPLPGALGLLETMSCPTVLSAADAAVKAARVELIEVRLARGLGGKCYFSLTGDVGAVQAAIAAGEAAIRETGLLLGSTVIPNPHKSLWQFVL